MTLLATFSKKPKAVHKTAKPKARRLLMMLLVASLFTSPAFAQNDGLVMNMRDADIRSLIQWVADNTGKNMVVHKAVQGDVTVLSTKPISKEEVYQVFLSVLQVNGYAAVESGNAVRILPEAVAFKGGAPITKTANSDIVVKLFALDFAQADDLVKTVKPLLSSQAIITAYDDSNTLIVADHGSNVDSISQLISTLDKKRNETVRIIRLKHAQASDIAASLSGILKDSKRSTSNESLSIDNRSNSLIIMADEQRHQELVDIVNSLDVKIEGQGNTQVVYLHYSKADDIAPILKSIASTMQKSLKTEEVEISVEAAEAANALVINAPPNVVTELKSVIEKLDIRRAQVLVEALIVEVRNEDLNQLGINWQSASDSSSGEIVASNINALTGLGITPGFTISDSNTIVPDLTARGLSLGFLDSGFQSVLRMLKSSTDSDVLSTPSVVALDNEEASLLVGQNVPFITGQSTGSASSTDNPFTTIQRQDVGTSLVVTPRINRGDSITLEINQKVESISVSTQAASDIITNKREIITKALIRDGQVLALGGLISDDDSDTRERVPILGDIPLVGKLFRGKSRTKTKTNLMVFIRPTIIKNDEHMASLTQDRYAFMKERQSQSYEERREAARKPVNLDDFELFVPAK